jgi:hypothetical protein
VAPTHAIDPPDQPLQLRVLLLLSLTSMWRAVFCRRNLAARFLGALTAAIYKAPKERVSDGF